MENESTTKTGKSESIMNQNEAPPKSRILVPFIAALIASLLAVAAFFFPYISSTEEYGRYLELQGDEQAIASVGVTYRDMKNLSLFEYSKIYFYGAKEIRMDEAAGIFYGVLISVIGVLSFLVLLAVLRKKPILIFVLNAMLGGLCYSLNWDFTDRGIMPDSNRIWGISYYMLYVCVAVIALSAIWMFVEKRKVKKAGRGGAV